MTTKEELAAFLAAEFPQTKVTVESVGGGKAVVRHAVGFEELRPGGTVSGPVLMAVADVGLYVALLGQIGITMPLPPPVSTPTSCACPVETGTSSANAGC